MSEKNIVEKEEALRKLWEITSSATNHLVGQLSTLLDAMLPDERQAKAAKDIARTLIWERKNEVDNDLNFVLSDLLGMEYIPNNLLTHC